jgi:predicted enzyme related to lactoylglutathione lyase
MNNPVVHFEVTGRDGLVLQRYYSDLFGWQIENNEALNYGAITPPEDRHGIGGGVGAAQPGDPGHVTFYVAVSDIEAMLSRAQELGGTRVMGPLPIPGLDIVVGQFTDPEGHLIGLVEGTVA